MNKISVYTALLIILAAFTVQLTAKRWNTDFGVVQGDVKGYYAYLPLLFIYDDIKVEHFEQYRFKDNYRIWTPAAADGRRHIKYTVGMAILYAPFFFIGHILASVLGYPVDGFSLPYQVMLAISSLFFMVTGIFYLRKLLKIYFNDLVVAISLLVIYLGTNLFAYYTQKMCLSHGYSFALIAVFLYASIRWLSNHKLKWTMVLGVCGGLMVLIRPVDLIFFLFPLLYNVRSWRQFLERLQLVWKNYLHVLLFVFLLLLVFLPQFIYWKYSTGHFVFDSYTDEHFYFLKPNTLRAFFSFRNGWLIYSPVMLFSIVGIFQLRKGFSQVNTPVAIIVPVYIYVITSWWCWWYVGFGNRAFINLYPLLSIAVAAFIHYFLKRKKPIKFAFLLVLGSLVLFNLFQTRQMSTGAIHWGDMSKAAYWDSFGKLLPSQLFPTYLKRADLRKAKEGEYVLLKPEYQILIDEYIDFEGDSVAETISLNLEKAKTGPSLSGTKSVYSPQNALYALSVKFPLLDADEVYITVWIKNGSNCAIVLTSNDSVPFYKNSREYIDSNNDWKLFNIFTRFNPVHKKPSVLHFYIYNTGRNKIRADDLHIITRKVSYCPEPAICNFF
ncbi:MAG: hypothetical protein L3J66_01605 [Bacteroidales bacterium]|nr:hypothetical protein [Bacteroidales bacterium]